MNTPPAITINGKKIVLPKPKIKLWRRMIKFSELQQSGELQGEDVLDEMIGLVETAFSNPEVTREAIEENVSMDDLVPLFDYIRDHVTGVAYTKASQIPKNGIAPAGV